MSKALEDKRGECAADDAGDITDFHVHIRGGAWLQCQRGMYLDAFRGTARAFVEGWCEAYGFGKTIQFAVVRSKNVPRGRCQHTRPRTVSPRASPLRQVASGDVAHTCQDAEHADSVEPLA